MRFRNVDVEDDAPVSMWPTEAVQAALERGSLAVWRRLASEISAEPWGPVARAVEEVLGHSRPYGVAEVFESIVDGARREHIADERRAVSEEVGALVERSGLTQEEFAGRIGTSASRLSTYVSGSVVPSSTLLVRMRRVARPHPH